MEDDEKNILITKEKTLDKVVDRVKGASIATAAISFVALLGKYIFKIPQVYSEALLISIGLPATIQVVLWFLSGEKLNVNEKFGFILPTILLYGFFLFFILPSTVEELINVSILFTCAHLTAIAIGVTSLYFNKIIKKGLRFKLLVSVGMSVVLGLFLTLVWTHFGVV